MCTKVWRTLIGIIDGTVMAYDSQFYQLLSTIPESKGCHLFAVHEKTNTVVVINKKKLSCYGWQSPGFVLRREVNLVDVPKSVCCMDGAAVVGYKKFYECVDLSTGIASRLLDVEKECRMVALEVRRRLDWTYSLLTLCCNVNQLPAIAGVRGETVLLALGLQGVLLEASRVLAGASFAFGSASEERMEWAGQPVAVSVVNPFLVSLLADQVEVHDLVSLHSLQRIQITSASPHILSMCTAFVEAIPTPFSNTSSGGSSSTLPSSASQCVFVCNGEQLSVLKMLSIGNQVATLVSAGLFEEAIALCAACTHPDYTRGINVPTLYEQSAAALLAKGDFDRAMASFVLAGTDFVSVVRQLPELVPLPLHAVLNISIQVCPSPLCWPALCHGCE